MSEVPIKKRYKQLVKHRVTKESFERFRDKIDETIFTKPERNPYNPNESIIFRFDQIVKELDNMLDREIRLNRVDDLTPDTNREQLLLLASEISNKIKNRLKTLRIFEPNL